MEPSGMSKYQSHAQRLGAQHANLGVENIATKDLREKVEVLKAAGKALKATVKACLTLEGVLYTTDPEVFEQASKMRLTSEEIKDYLFFTPFGPINANNHLIHSSGLDSGIMYMGFPYHFKDTNHLKSLLAIPNVDTLVIQPLMAALQIKLQVLQNLMDVLERKQKELPDELESESESGSKGSSSSSSSSSSAASADVPREIPTDRIEAHEVPLVVPAVAGKKPLSARRWVLIGASALVTAVALAAVGAVAYSLITGDSLVISNYNISDNFAWLFNPYGIAGASAIAVVGMTSIIGICTLKRK